MKHLKTETDLTVDEICAMARDDDQLATLSADWSPRMVSEEAEAAVAEVIATYRYEHPGEFVSAFLEAAAVRVMIERIEQDWMNLIADAQEVAREEFEDMLRDGIVDANGNIHPDRRHFG